jgi:hypothetical protein
MAAVAAVGSAAAWDPVAVLARAATAVAWAWCTFDCNTERLEQQHKPRRNNQPRSTWRCSTWRCSSQWTTTRWTTPARCPSTERCPERADSTPAWPPPGSGHGVSCCTLFFAALLHHELDHCVMEVWNQTTSQILHDACMVTNEGPLVRKVRYSYPPVSFLAREPRCDVGLAASSPLLGSSRPGGRWPRFVCVCEDCTKL